MFLLLWAGLVDERGIMVKKTEEEYLSGGDDGETLIYLAHRVEEKNWPFFCVS